MPRDFITRRTLERERSIRTNVLHQQLPDRNTGHQVHPATSVMQWRINTGPGSKTSRIDGLHLAGNISRRPTTLNINERMFRAGFP